MQHISFKTLVVEESTNKERTKGTAEAITFHMGDRGNTTYTIRFTGDGRLEVVKDTSHLDASIVITTGNGCNKMTLK